MVVSVESAFKPGYTEDDFYEVLERGPLKLRSTRGLLGRLRTLREEVDRDRQDLDRMLLEYWPQPNTKQRNIRIPPSAKRMIEKLAKRKTVDVSTLVRMWVIEGLRREAAQP